MSIKFILARYILPLIFLSFHLTISADNDIYFYRLGAKDGLSQVNIMSIYQDEFGTMWFGSTEGLNRYNGRGIEIFRPDRKGEGLSQNTIYEICGNKNGVIYMRSDGDLIRYDIHAQKFENIQRGGVAAITYADGILWVVVKNKILQYDEQSKQFKEYTVLKNISSGVISMYCAKDRSIWIGTFSGLYLISGKNPKEQRCVKNQVQVNRIYQDRNSDLWIGTFHNGVFVTDPQGNIKYDYRHKQGVNSISNDQIRSFVEDDQGNMWVGTFYGLNMFNPQTKQWKQYVNSDNITHSLSHSSIFSLYKDRQGTIWIGTYFGGVNYFNPDADVFRFYEPNSIIESNLSFPYVGRMTEDKYNNLWVCTEGGTLNCLNLKTRQFSRYLINETDPESLIGYNQKAIWYNEKKDLLYIGMYNRGLAILDIKTKASRVLVKSEYPGSLPNNTINKMQYYDGSLYLLTQAGIVRMDIETERFHPVSDSPEIQRAVVDVGIHAFLIDSRDCLWVAIGLGVRSINLKNGKIKDYLYNDSDERSIGRFNIQDIFESSKGELFFATMGSGIYRYNPNTNDFDNYTEEKNGLLNNYCYSISEAPSGKLILLHNRGFALFDPENPSGDLFISSSGFPIVGFNIGNSCYVTRDKEIFIGGINGLVSFFENDLNKVNEDYSLFFDKLFINNQQVLPGDKFGILKETLPLCREIDLKYDQNNITIEFATSNYLQTMTRKYEYKLDGFDENWLPTRTRRISYTNLNTGTYTLFVRETSQRGSEEGKVYSLIINIKPPFYLTTIAFIIYALLILLAIFGVFKFYIWRTKMETTLEFERKDKERIEELNQTKLRFFTSVSHEFRTPLTLIKGQVETLLLQGELNPKTHSKLTKIHKNANHLQNLISELLDFRKQEQGFYKLNIKCVELVAYIREIYSSFEDYAVKGQIKYKFEHSDEEIYVYIDPVHFQKAIYNLLSNAFKYTSPGGEITLKIKLQKTDVLIQIIDSGIGIPPESLNKVFERFYQLEYRSSGLTLGTGIGLALTKEIVNGHRGDISVESMLNEGSVFTISLKLGTSHFSEEELNLKDVNADANTVEMDVYEGDDDVIVEESINIDGERPTVLLVDDNESLLEMLTDSFTPYYNVHTAINGKEGLEMIYKVQPDLVISDIMMPEVSGKELCYKMKNNVDTAHIPIILLTAQTSDSQIMDGYMFGADAYITKPFNIRMLITRCNNLIKNRQILYKKFANQKEDIMPFDTVTEQDQVLIGKTVAIIRQNFGNTEFDMNKLAAELGMGRSKLYMKIKEITGFTPNEMTLNLKLQEAANMLDNKRHMNVSEIAFELGFSSTKYFTKCFKTFYGMVPQDWRKRNKPKE